MDRGFKTWAADSELASKISATRSTHTAPGRKKPSGAVRYLGLGFGAAWCTLTAADWYLTLPLEEVRLLREMGPGGELLVRPVRRRSLHRVASRVSNYLL